MIHYTGYTTYGTRTFFRFHEKHNLASALRAFQDKLCVMAVSKSGVIYRYKGNNRWNRD